MFTTLEIKNFKSIGHAKFDLGKINVLTGQSNLGKSNVVQALYCLTHNHWDSNYMKWGTKKCSITLTDDTGAWVEYRHNETSAEYSLSLVEQPFTKIGRDVPGPVKDFLKMNEVQFDEDLFLDFNFERQFDPAFVISLSGFELAKVFGKIMNLDIVLSASRNINKDLAALRKNVDGQEAVENVSIEYIQKNYPIELKYALLHNAIKIDEKAEELERKNNQLLSLITDLEYYNACAKTYSDFLSSESAKQIDIIQEPIQGLDNVITSLVVAQKAQEVYSNALRDKMPEFDFDVLYGLINGLTGLIQETEKVNVYNSVLSSCDIIDYTLIDDINEKKDVLNTLTQWGIEADYETTQLKNQDTLIEKEMSKFSRFLKENNICPISGKPFMDGCVNSILGSVSVTTA